MTEFVPEQQTDNGNGEAPRIGVYICHCGLNIASTVNCAEVAEYASTLADVAVSRENMYSCADPGQNQIKDDIRDYKLNRVVVAACSVKMHGPTFMRACEEAGLNPYLFEMANIREHCSWVHMKDKEGGTRKAMDQVRMAVAKARYLKPLEDRLVPVTRAALVVGGGVAGMSSALDIAEAGFPVYLAEKSASLGGNALRLERVFDRLERAGCLVSPLAMETMAHPLITVMPLTQVAETDGYVGNFDVTLRTSPRRVTSVCDACGRCAEVCPVEVPDEMQAGLATRKAIYLPSRRAVPQLYCVDEEACDHCGKCEEACPLGAIQLDQEEEDTRIQVGAVVLATGAKPYQPPEQNPWGYKEGGDVLTTPELERMLDPLGPTGGALQRPSDGSTPSHVAFIQCVGSRDPEGNEWCSRICCMNTIKQSILMKKRYPETQVSVYHHDIRAYKKEHEDLFRLARELGVTFLRAKVEGVSRSGPGLMVRAADDILKKTTEQAVDMVVLAVGLIPGTETEGLKDMMKVPLSGDGFFAENHPKLRPLETVIDGVMLAGCCQSPKDLGDSISQADGAAAKALGLLTKDQIQLDAIISHVDQELCSGCLICVKKCPFKAVVTDEVQVGEKIKKRARVVEAACKGCGVCAARCPKDAIEAQSFTDAQIFAQIEAALENDPGDKILALTCHW